MQTKSIIIALLFITSGIFYYHITDVSATIQTLEISQVIDGDTAKSTEGQTIRLLGVNTPEKSLPFSEEATTFLTKQIQNKQIQIESYGVDKYGRTLAYAFSDNKNINKEILLQGLGTLYYYEKDKYYAELQRAEEFARLNQKGLWKKSPNSNCLELIELKIEEPEQLILQNNCNKKIQITFKDDATHIYHETLIQNSQFTKQFSHIWNDEGDSLYVSDDKGLLIFYRY